MAKFDADKVSRLVKAIQSGKNQPMWSTGSRASRAPTNNRVYTQADIDKLNAKMNNDQYYDQVVGRKYIDQEADYLKGAMEMYGTPDDASSIIGRNLIQNEKTGHLIPEPMFAKDKVKLYDLDEVDQPDNSMSYDEAVERLRNYGLLGKTF